jgi:hypothetical protein
MLAAMVETWVLWLFIVGVAVGLVAALVVAVRLPRQEDDVSDLERPAEAAWISSVIERHGGIAPESLVEEILDLHQAYLRDPRLARPPDATPPVASGPSHVSDPAAPWPTGYQAWDPRQQVPSPSVRLPSPPDQVPAPPGPPVGAVTQRPPR